MGKTVALALPVIFLGVLGALAWPGAAEPSWGELTCASSGGTTQDLSGGLVETQADLETETPTTLTQATTAEPPKVAQNNWWEGKEDLRRRIERARYFNPIEADDASEEGEVERLAKRREFVFEEFIAWLKKYRREDDPAERALLVREGVVRATIRQRELRAIQISDPGEMAKLEIPASLREAMPEEVRKIVTEGGE